MTNLELKHKELMEEFDKRFHARIRSIAKQLSPLARAMSEIYGRDPQGPQIYGEMNDYLAKALSQIAEVATEESFSFADEAMVRMERVSFELASRQRDHIARDIIVSILEKYTETKLVFLKSLKNSVGTEEEKE